jgi:hypothetical protein
MGAKDSSKTRIVLVFDTLDARDVSGASWIDSLIALGSRTEVVAPLPKGQGLVPDHRQRWGKDEASLPAPMALLEHLVKNADPERVKTGVDSDDAAIRRAQLARKDPETIALALGRAACAW